VAAKRSGAIIDYYLDRIISGELTAGTTLPTESKMIEQFGVSRTVVREAVQALAAKGFLRVRQGSGSTVTERREWNVLDPAYLQRTGVNSLGSHLSEALDIIEPAIATLAAHNATAEQITALSDVVDQLAAANAKTAAELDATFHQLLAEASGNTVLVSVRGSLADLVQAQEQQVVEQTATPTADQATFWFRPIADAVAAKDSSGAHDAMRMHLRQLHKPTAAE
jgi:DNA-binding FadR family transcriptional regulator